MSQRRPRMRTEDKEERPRRPYQRRTEDGDSSQSSPRRPYQRRNEDGDSSQSSPRRPYQRRTEDREERPRRPYQRRTEDSEERPRRPYQRRTEDREERPRRPYQRRTEDGDSSQSSPRRPYQRRTEDREERPRRPYQRRTEDSEERPRRPYQKRTEDREERPKRPYQRRTEGGEDRPRRPYQRRTEGGEDSPRRPYQRRTEGGEERPKRPYQRRTEDREEGQSRPYQRRSDDWKDSDSKPFRKKSYGKDEDSYRPVRKNYEKKSSPRTPSRKQNAPEGSIRLNKYIADAGVCSRREADDLIVSGAVKVNGVIITVLGTKILPTDKVQIGDQTLSRETLKYVLLNKPKGYITTLEDPEGRKTVMFLVRDACRERIYPVGRLDRNTTGVLLFTNDGEITKKLTHPKHGIRKVYHVVLDQPLEAKDLETIENGLEVEDGFIKVDAIAVLGDGKDKRQLGIEIHSGRNRIVRKIFETLGYSISTLDRVIFAGLTKKDLPRGRWRFLTKDEVNFLKMLG